MPILSFTAFTLLAALAISAPESLSADPELGVQVIDARPAKQKTQGFESLGLMSCSYGSMRVGDKMYGRDRIALLAKAISDNFQSLSGRQIIVKNYVVHHNLSVPSRRLARNVTAVQVGGAIGGAIGASHKSPETGTVVGCSPDDLQGGYTSGESGITNSPIITVIDLEVDGRPFHFRSVSDTYKPGDGGRNRRKTSEANFQRAQSETIDRIIPELAAFLQTTIDGR